MYIELESQLFTPTPLPAGRRHDPPHAFTLPVTVALMTKAMSEKGLEAAAGISGVHLPRQRRSRRTFDRMLDAARALMAEGGIEAVTVQDVIARAGVGAGSFYARFDGRDTLIRYLHELEWGEGERWWADFLDPGRWEGWDLPARVGEVARVLVRTHFAREPVLRALWTRAVARPADGIMERTAEWDASFVESVAGLMAERREEIGHPNPERAARLAAFQLLTTLRGHLFFPDSLVLESRFSLEELILELTRSVLGYLAATGAPESYSELLAASARRRSDDPGR